MKVSYQSLSEGFEYTRTFTRLFTRLFNFGIVEQVADYAPTQALVRVAQRFREPFFESFRYRVVRQ
jgi:hypothetical protein